MLTTGTIKLNEHTWNLGNVSNINGTPLLYNQIEEGLYACEQDGKMTVYKINPTITRNGVTNEVLDNLIVDCGTEWTIE